MADTINAKSVFDGPSTKPEDDINDSLSVALEFVGLLRLDINPKDPIQRAAIALAGALYQANAHLAHAISGDQETMDADELRQLVKVAFGDGLTGERARIPELLSDAILKTVDHIGRLVNRDNDESGAAQIKDLVEESLRVIRDNPSDSLSSNLEEGIYALLQSMILVAQALKLKFGTPPKEAA